MAAVTDAEPLGLCMCARAFVCVSASVCVRDGGAELVGALEVQMLLPHWARGVRSCTIRGSWALGPSGCGSWLRSSTATCRFVSPSLSHPLSPSLSLTLHMCVSGSGSGCSRTTRPCVFVCVSVCAHACLRPPVEVRQLVGSSTDSHTHIHTHTHTGLGAAVPPLVVPNGRIHTRPPPGVGQVSCSGSRPRRRPGPSTGRHRRPSP